ncbi:hypothetical protein J7L48_04040, partial [bacterium]|nr:hypothetical protein [bacterium]
VIYIYYLLILLFGKRVSLFLYIISMILLLCGFFIRILSNNKKIFVNTQKAEGLYKTTRHPMLFSYFFYALPIPIFLGFNFLSIALFTLFIFFIYATFQLSEKFYVDMYSQSVFYRSNTPALIPNMKISLREIFKKGAKSIIDTYEIIPAISPLLAVIFVEHLGLVKFLGIIKNIFI